MSKDGSSFFYPTLLSEAAKWAQKNSLWPMPFGTSCCGIEMMSTLSSTYDLSRFGAEVVRFSPRQADMLIVATDELTVAWASGAVAASELPKRKASSW